MIFGSCWDLATLLSTLAARRQEYRDLLLAEAETRGVVPPLRMTTVTPIDTTLRQARRMVSFRKSRRTCELGQST